MARAASGTFSPVSPRYGLPACGADSRKADGQKRPRDGQRDVGYLLGEIDPL